MNIQVINKYIELVKPFQKFNVDKFIRMHSPKQKEYINSPTTTTLAYGGKRAGKSLASSSLIAIMDQESESDARIEIAGQSLEKVKLLHKRNLEKLSKFYKLKWQYNAGASMFETPRREIVFRSLRDLTNADKSVGFSVLMVLIEEAQTIREHIVSHYLDNVIRVNLMGVPGARINFAMNPPVAPQPWITQQIYMNPEVKKVHFTPNDNPKYSKRLLKKFLEKHAKDLGYKSVEEATENSNAFKRNILGLWIPDMGRVVINPERVTTYDTLPSDHGSYKAVLGVDVGGGKSKDAIVAIIYNIYEKKAWLAEELEIDSSDKDIEDLATNIKKFSEKWKPHAIAFDTGGVGQRLAMILRTRYGIPGVISAKKQDKMAWLETMRTEAYRGRLLFHNDSELLKELNQIIYTEDKLKIDDENGIHSDLIDACLYAFRHVYNSYPQPRPVEKSYKQKRIDQFLRNKSGSRLGN